MLNVIRTIELNPVRARLVLSAEDWRWSSVHSHGRSPGPTDSVIEDRAHSDRRFTGSKLYAGTAVS